MVQLEGGRLQQVTNDLYRRVINRNNRLKRFIKLNAPRITSFKTKTYVTSCGCFDGRRGRPVTGPGNRPLNR